MIKKFTQLAGENSFQCAPQSDGKIRVVAKTINVYKIITKFLKDMNISFHTYQVRSEKSFDVVINKFHRSFDINELKSILTAKGHKVRSATVMQRRVFDKESERPVRVLMDKFLVHLEPAPNNKEVYDINVNDHCVVSVEALDIPETTAGDVQIV